MKRYIDADAIQYRKVCKEEIDGNMRVEYMVLRDEIDVIPTADVRENVKGEWEEYRDWKHGSFKHRCSECGYHDNERDDLGTYNYCPHCGADMRGES